MKILPYVNLYQKTNYSLKSNNYSPLKPLSRDTVSFGYLYEKIDNNTPLYRSIGKKEFEKLMTGEKIVRIGGYATSDPRGWDANDWDSGYCFQNEDETYFITFKTGNLDDKFMSAKESSRDTRYKLMGYYSIDDVQNIRKGKNVHGELIYSENLEQDKQIDQELKKKEITGIENLIESTNNFKVKNAAWSELKSYVEEFPGIIDDVKDIVDFNDQADVVGYADLISKLGRESDKSEYRKCLKSYVDGLLPSVDWSYLVKYAEMQDMSSIMALVDRRRVYPEVVVQILNRLGNEQTVIDDFLKPESTKLHVLTLYFSNKNQNGDYTDIYRQALRELHKIKVYNYDHDYDYEHAVIDSVNQLALHGNTNDIPLIEKFCSKNQNGFYNYPEAIDAIEQIKSTFPDIELN